MRTTTNAPTVSFSEDNIIVLKYTFDDVGTDTIEAWGFAESEALSEATFNANAISASALIDETTLNIISFSQSRGTGGIDEIRLGDTFADVTPAPTGGTTLIGDFNDDDIVNLEDYTTWRNNLGNPDSTINDSGDGVDPVTTADYDLWKGNFGDSNTGSVGGSVVPEPSSLVLLASIAGFGLLRIHRSFKNRR